MYYDYGFILTVLSVISGLIWLIDVKVWKPQRVAVAEDAQKSGKDEAEVGKLLEEPIYVDYARSFFPILVVILIVRSFLYEPFRIPSGSMMPTLLIGDFILVNKFAYGVRLPITHTKIFDNGEPERGDIMVFKNPINPAQDYIKRVVGLPGDKVLYRPDKTLTIIPACAEPNKIEGQCEQKVNIPAVEDSEQAFSYYDSQFKAERPLNVYKEDLGEVEHKILKDPMVSEFNRVGRYQKNYRRGQGLWIVPEGHYFVLGDNRDNSQDSRYWGFVPKDLVVGKAVGIWMHIELTDEPVIFGWRFPSDVKFSRIGGIE